MKWIMSAFGSAAVLVLLVGAVACSADGSSSNDPWPNDSSSDGESDGKTDGKDGGSAGKGGGGLGRDGGLSGSGGGGGFIDLGEAGTVSPGCPHQDDQDHDGDGYSFLEGDCNDCDPNMNPGAFDVVGGKDGEPGLDEDCSGTVDDEPTGCDTDIAIDSTDPFDGARAIGICRRANASATGKDRTWGVISAKYVRADGTGTMNALAHGILPVFGAAKVQDGMSMLAISSGAARAPGQPGFISPIGGGMLGPSGKAPEGYPKESPACPGVKTGAVNDPAALELVIRTPTNAKSFSFNLNFYTYEFPEFICSKYNDFYVTMMMPKVPDLPDGNISFDQDGNPISVNNSLLQVCKSQTAGGREFSCPLGTALLANTGYDELAASGPHAATGWLKTLAPVTPGSEITLRFAIWDSGDTALDSLVLIDNFKWSVEAASSAATVPVPVPK